ncbi:hypothetical protein HY524_01255 [Candidatus Berkelbacteria bacterium]|nr:hypothetical protein [Candidatus Berkelbacteria bacterium]
MKPTIVVVANPFGYGPAGKAIAVAEEFHRRGNTHVLIVGSSFIKEIIPSVLEFREIDERNEKEIVNFLTTVENPVIFSSQNRFAIRAAKQINIPNAFLDGLSWFWHKIPHDHLLADEIFWMNYPDMLEKAQIVSRAITLVPAVVSVPQPLNNRKGTLIHLGGCRNPLVELFPKQYLDLLLRALKESTIDVTITGGADVIDFIRRSGFRGRAESLQHTDFVNALNKSKHFLTTAGQTATLEAFALGVPTSFLPPMNLSQLALTDLLSPSGAASQQLQWSNYDSDYGSIRTLTEKEALPAFASYAEALATDPEKLTHYTNDLSRILQTLPDRERQQSFIRQMGVDGQRIIVDHLIDVWDL